MTPPDTHPEPDPSAHSASPRGPWNPKRTELHQWLADKAPLAASIYAGAVAIVADDEIPSRNYFLWHAIREIRSHLPHVINEGTTRRFDAGGYIQEVGTRWDRAGLPRDPARGADDAEADPDDVQPPPAGTGPLDEDLEPDPSGRRGTTTIDANVTDAIVTMINAQASVGTKFRAANQKALTKIFGREVTEYAAKVWTEAFERSADKAHLGNEAPGIDLLDEAVEWFERFEGALMTITNRNYENQDLLDALLEEANGS